MPTQVYRCPEHGEFDQQVPFKDKVLDWWGCPKCGLPSDWVPSASPLIGGPTTGAQAK